MLLYKINDILDIIAKKLRNDSVNKKDKIKRRV